MIQAAYGMPMMMCHQICARSVRGPFGIWKWKSDWKDGLDGFVYCFIGQFISHMVLTSIDMRHCITVKIRQ